MKQVKSVYTIYYLFLTRNMKQKDIITIARSMTASSLLLALTFLSTSAYSATLQPFSLTYAVNYSIANGEMTLSLSESGEGQYTIESVTQAKGMAKLAIPNPVREKAVFDLREGTVRALSYHLDDGSESSNEDISITYNWDAMQAEIQSEKGSEKQALTADTMDQLIMQAAAIANIQAGKETFAYQQIKPGRSIQTYHYTKRGNEDIQGPDGIISTIKYERGRVDSDKSTFYWFAPELGYAPVKIERFKKGKSVFKGKLKTIH